MNELIRCLIMKEVYLMNYIKETLKQNKYNNIIATKDYIYAEGTVPVMLLAHTDIVHKTEPTKKDLFTNSEKSMISSHTGLGADDRAGISAILSIIKSGHKPSVLFLTGEESGGIGARIAVSEISNTIINSNVNILIELDRRGYNQFVTYNCDNEKMDSYLENFGLTKEYGTFSDISIIAPAVKIAAANVSIGYYKEHTINEFIVLDEYDNMIDYVKRILISPPKERLIYISKTNKYSSIASSFYELNLNIDIEYLEEMDPNIDWEDFLSFELDTFYDSTLYNEINNSLHNIILNFKNKESYHKRGVNND